MIAQYSNPETSDSSQTTDETRSLSNNPGIVLLERSTNETNEFVSLKFSSPHSDMGMSD